MPFIDAEVKSASDLYTGLHPVHGLYLRSLISTYSTRKPPNDMPLLCKRKVYELHDLTIGRRNTQALWACLQQPSSEW